MARHASSAKQAELKDVIYVANYSAGLVDPRGTSTQSHTLATESHSFDRIREGPACGSEDVGRSEVSTVNDLALEQNGSGPNPHGGNACSRLVIYKSPRVALGPQAHKRPVMVPSCLAAGALLTAKVVFDEAGSGTI